MAQGSIVREWLKSLCLGEYTEAFLDNGYDDLEVCKQIGEPDLDAIGVEDEDHRQRLVEAVGTLRRHGGALVYFTLEEAQAQLTGGSNPVPVAFPPAQLRSLISDKLREEGVDLTTFISSQSAPPCGADVHLSRLAALYAEHLHTYVDDVIEALNDIIHDVSTTSQAGVQSTHVYDLVSVYGNPEHSSTLQLYSTYEEPAETPTSPPAMSAVRSPRHGATTEAAKLSTCHQQQTDGSTKDISGSRSSTLSRLLRSVKLRHSGRKYTYKPHEGDLSAAQMTMGDEERMQLMLLVKEGKISMEQAVETVKHFEHRRKLLQGGDNENDSITSDITPDTSSVGDESPKVCHSPSLQQRKSSIPLSHTKKVDQTPKYHSPVSSPRRGWQQDHSLSSKPNILTSTYCRRKDALSKMAAGTQSVPSSPSTKSNRPAFSPRDALPPIPTLASQSVQSDRIAYHHRPHFSCQHVLSSLHGYRRSSEHHLPLPARSPTTPRRQSVPKRSFSDYENLKYLSRSDTNIGLERDWLNARRKCYDHVSCSSDIALYALASRPNSQLSTESGHSADHLYDQPDRPVSSSPPHARSPKRPYMHMNSTSSESVSSQTDCNTLKYRKPLMSAGDTGRVSPGCTAAMVCNSSDVVGIYDDLEDTDDGYNAMQGASCGWLRDEYVRNEGSAEMRIQEIHDVLGDKYPRDTSRKSSRDGSVVLGNNSRGTVQRVTNGSTTNVDHSGHSKELNTMEHIQQSGDVITICRPYTTSKTTRKTLTTFSHQKPVRKQTKDIGTATGSVASRENHSTVGNKTMVNEIQQHSTSPAHVRDASTQHGGSLRRSKVRTGSPITVNTVPVSSTENGHVNSNGHSSKRPD